MTKVISTANKVTRDQTKAHNQRLILKSIYEKGPISRAELARATYLSRATISKMMTSLLHEKWVVETGQARKNIGKPATLVTVNRDGHCLIGLDVANSIFRGCIFNLRGEVMDRAELDRNGAVGEAALAHVYSLVETLKERAMAPVLGIGVGSPGVVEPRQGLVKRALKLGWTDLPLRDLLQERFQLPVHISNDAQIAAFAQFVFGERDQDAKSLVMVKVGEGIGSGIVYNGNIFYGDSFSAGEIGHVVVDREGKLCTCGHRGCLETLASTRALIEEISEIARVNPSSKLYASLMEGGQLTLQDVLAAHESGDYTIRPVIERVGRRLGQSIAHLVAALNIRNIYITGAMSRFGDLLLQPIQQELSAVTFPAFAHEVKICLSQLGRDIVALGAAALVLNQELGVV